MANMYTELPCFLNSMQIDILRGLIKSKQWRALKRIRGQAVCFELYRDDIDVSKMQARKRLRAKNKHRAQRLFYRNLFY
jgi:hypothetical protein